MKKKVVNDPVYGFITISGDLLFKLIEHPYFQRLRRIKQLGLAEYVYPGALHTRFHHAIGSLHLMTETLENLKQKGIEITQEETFAAQAAILLHDIGHGPFSHSLENVLFVNLNHEHISLMIMEMLASEFKGELDLSLTIFSGKYKKKFLCELVSSQLDIDRLDYINRDSFFTGVSEGTIGSDRIIKMFTVVDNELVVEEKAIYSVENFLNTRRLMYWQVYFHKTAIAAEVTLIQMLRRAKKLVKENKNLFLSDALRYFMDKEITLDLLKNDFIGIENFLRLDDYDLWFCIKQWAHGEDKILATLAKNLLNRNLPKVILTDKQWDEEHVLEMKSKTAGYYGISLKDASYFCNTGLISNSAYLKKGNSIKILTKKGEIKNIDEASDLPNIKALSKVVKKHYFCFPKCLVYE
jgi:HD superfamily phosphohydrolase